MNTLRNKRILVVDDDKIIRDLLFRTLQPAGCLVSVATDGLAGLKALDESNVDVVISDVSMPEMDGITFVREALKRHPHLTALLITGYSDSLSRRESFEIGVADLIVKPFKNIEIIHSLRKALAISAELRSRTQT